MSATETWQDYIDRAKADLQMIGLRLREKNCVLAESWLVPATRSLDAAYIAGIHMEADHNAARQVAKLRESDYLELKRANGLEDELKATAQQLAVAVQALDYALLAVLTKTPLNPYLQEATAREIKLTYLARIAELKGVTQ